MRQHALSDQEALVSKWVDAFNMRDLGGLLARMDPDVLFYPLRLNGVESSYRGHDGVREWFAHLERIKDRHRIALSELHPSGEDEVLAMGELHPGEGADTTPFWARSRIERRRILIAHHYLTEPSILEKVGRPHQA